MFQRVAKSGKMTELIPGGGPLYSYVPSTPIVVKPGYMLGVKTRDSFIELGFLSVDHGNAPTYYETSRSSEIIIDWHMRKDDRLIPLVTVELSEIHR